MAARSYGARYVAANGAIKLKRKGDRRRRETLAEIGGVRSSLSGPRRLLQKADIRLQACPGFKSEAN